MIRIRKPSSKGDECVQVTEEELRKMVGTYLLVGSRPKTVMVPQQIHQTTKQKIQQKEILVPTIDKNQVELFAIQGETELNAEIAKASAPDSTYSITVMPNLVGG